MDTHGSFKINVSFDDHSNTEEILIKHTDETFSFFRNGQQISIINNGDNSWSLIEGDLDQLVVNLIGTEIEKHYRKL
ncbi:hypothetical protein [Mucilaginibacter lacusdianchii]|uniref:hypothetical protein n=1 Tax=Mucilaginibacter lacusdianchii TaxID=2684211 RepID=UPI00131D88EF|nr:hypothetical protein [Mucilaginibacter sp. JXJ CY 39]